MNHKAMAAKEQIEAFRFKISNPVTTEKELCRRFLGVPAAFVGAIHKSTGSSSNLRRGMEGRAFRSFKKSLAEKKLRLRERKNGEGGGNVQGK